MALLELCSPCSVLLLLLAVQFRLPFDPAADYHTYAIMWNARQIVWLVDGTPLRILNRTPEGPWPKNAMKAHVRAHTYLP